jgi:hypothetical protein
MKTLYIITLWEDLYNAVASSNRNYACASNECSLNCPSSLPALGVHRACSGACLMIVGGPIRRSFRSPHPCRANGQGQGQGSLGLLGRFVIVEEATSHSPYYLHPPGDPINLINCTIPCLAHTNSTHTTLADCNLHPRSPGATFHRTNQP